MVISESIKVLDVDALEGVNLEEFMAAVAAMAANGGMAVDDHNGRRTKAAVGLMTHYGPGWVGSTRVVALFEGTPFCLNRIEVRNGVPHITPWSVGGVVDPAGTLEETLEGYNALQDEGDDLYGGRRIVAYATF